MEKPSLDTAKAGAMRFNTDSSQLEIYDGSQWTGILSRAPENETGGTRGVWAGGSTEPPGQVFDIMDFTNIETTGNLVDFGDLPSSRQESHMGTVASKVRGFLCGGDGAVNNIFSWVHASTGSASDYADLNLNAKQGFGLSNHIRGIIGAGYVSPSYQNSISYFVMASQATAVDYGDFTPATGNDKHYAGGGMCDGTRGVIVRGYDGSNYKETLEYINVMSTGSPSDFGDLSSIHNTYTSTNANGVRGIVAGGYQPSPSNFYNTIQFITIQTLGNSQDFGDLTTTRSFMQGCNSRTRCVWSGGINTAPVATGKNVVDYIQMMSTGNAVDFGDSTQGRRQSSAASNGHGGL